MNYRERPLQFSCAGESLLGILTEPERPPDWGVLIVVGGPQYRAGSHRQFVLLARRLAASGLAVLRFDYRGMGDSGGDRRDFTAVSEDIGAALDGFSAACPSIGRVVLWGLCDAAAASLLYCRERVDARVAGLVLLNPWVRSPATLARTQLKHYYGRRLLDGRFWRKLLRGEVGIAASLREFLSKFASLAGRPGREAAGDEPFQTRMAAGLRRFAGPVCLILSGNDYTAREFVDYAGSDPAWAGLLARMARYDFAAADHTFSAHSAREAVEQATLGEIRRWQESQAAAGGEGRPGRAVAAR